jgi:aspartokinase
MAVSNTSNQLFPSGSPGSCMSSLPATSVSSHYSNTTNGSSSKLETILHDLRPLGTVSFLTGMAILSLVGRRMRNMVGVAGKMFSTLARANVNIEVISQGASEVNIR